jgi:hypothetical protein
VRLLPINITTPFGRAPRAAPKPAPIGALPHGRGAERLRARAPDSQRRFAVGAVGVTKEQLCRSGSTSREPSQRGRAPATFPKDMEMAMPFKLLRETHVNGQGGCKTFAILCVLCTASVTSPPEKYNPNI